MLELLWQALEPVMRDVQDNELMERANVGVQRGEVLTAKPQFARPLVGNARVYA